VREFLERNYKDDMTRDETIKLTIKSLLEVVQTGAKNIEIAILENGKPLEVRAFDYRTNCSFLILSRSRLL
jgi:20S proteasome subunit alpha 4